MKVSIQTQAMIRWCHRSYDEMQTPTYAVVMMDAVLRAEKLRKKDPAGAEQLLAGAEKAFDAASSQELYVLRERVHTDPLAAQTLRLRLEAQLKGLGQTRRLLERERNKDPRSEIGLQNLEGREQSIREELVGLGAAIARARSSRT
jgi:hypothetical protein